MRYGIFSDIHGNLEAMESVIAAFQNEKIDNYFCVGDVVGYGANPHECIEALKALGAVTIAGNHDWGVVDKFDTAYFNLMAKQALAWTKDMARREDMAFLDRLKLIYKNNDFILVHGTLNEPEYFHYLVEERQAREMFRLMDRNVAFVGHTHVAGVFVLENDEIRYETPAQETLVWGARYIVNVGSVGQPRDGNPLASYCVFDTEENTIVIKRVEYDIEKAQRKIAAAGLPPFLAARLASGR